jgi:hypothetical protein
MNEHEFQTAGGERQKVIIFGFCHALSSQRLLRFCGLFSSN